MGRANTKADSGQKKRGKKSEAEQEKKEEKSFSQPPS